MLIGLVKWFDPDKGFGVVGTPDGKDFFLHINSFTTIPEKILKGTPIAFSPKIDKAKNRNSAEYSRLVGSAEDWKIILSPLGKSDSVKIEVIDADKITRKIDFKLCKEQNKSMKLLENNMK